MHDRRTLRPDASEHEAQRQERPPVAPPALSSAALARYAARRRATVARQPGGGTVAPAATTLADRLISGLEIYGPVNYDALIADVHASALAERRAALANARVRQLARERLGPDVGVSLISALLEGSQHWENPPANDFFDYFVTQKGTGTLRRPPP